MAGLHAGFGDVFGVAFAAEGFWFLVEAIFIAIYVWILRRLSRAARVRRRHAPR